MNMKDGRGVKQCEYCNIKAGTLICADSPSLMNFLILNLDVKVYTVPNPAYFSASGEEIIDILTYATTTELNFDKILESVEELLAERDSTTTEIYFFTISESLIRCKMI